MKKVLVIVLLIAMLFAAVSVASADPETKEEFYEEIDGLLTKIQESLFAEDYESAKMWYDQLVILCQKCGVFLSKIGEYDVRLQAVVEYARKALNSGNANDIVKFLTFANKANALVLMGTEDPEVESESSHS